MGKIETPIERRKSLIESFKKQKALQGPQKDQFKRIKRLEGKYAEEAYQWYISFGGGTSDDE